MPSAKTEATELSVAFGILGIEDPCSSVQDIQVLLGGTLNKETYQAYIAEFCRNTELYSRFIRCGLLLRDRQFKNIQSICWTGGQQQASTMMAAEDLFIPAVNMPISVKNESNVVANPSAHNLFRSLPRGEVVVSKGSDWFIEQDDDGLQALYRYARSKYSRSNELPETIIDFYDNVHRGDRYDFQQFIKSMPGQIKTKFTALYCEMCNRVATSSAEEFNRNISSLRPNARNAVIENVVKQFFRIDHIPYILTGIDHRHDFAVRIPDLTAWKREWTIQNIQAVARQGGQSMVSITLTIQCRSNHSEITLPYRVEIRWSHGKFCGNPESKLYKEFAWRDVPFFHTLF